MEHIILNSDDLFISGFQRGSKFFCALDIMLDNHTISETFVCDSAKSAIKKIIKFLVKTEMSDKELLVRHHFNNFL